MRGKQDIFFYEYVADAVGDKILPFSLYYSSKFDKENQLILAEAILGQYLGS